MRLSPFPFASFLKVRVKFMQQLNGNPTTDCVTWTVEEVSIDLLLQGRLDGTLKPQGG